MATKRKNEEVETLRKEAPGGVGRELIRAVGLHISNFLSRYVYVRLVPI